MKKFYFILVAAVSVALTSCMNDDFVGDSSGTKEATGAINFGFDFQKYTRGDIAGKSAADLLGSNFYVTGTKGDVSTASPTSTLVFDNYLVHYAANTANSTPSNTANWEYVGVTPDGTNYAKLGSYSEQAIKYWDFSQGQYDFLAFSTGTKKAVAKTDFAQIAADGEIGVTAMNSGTTLLTDAYTFYIPSVDALKDAYITDITTVAQANFGEEVSLKFKNLGSKVRVALYETIPGYSVKEVKFYDATTTPINSEATGYVTPTTDATLISSEGIPTKGIINVKFPVVGTTPNTTYNTASATVTTVTGATATTQTFGTLYNLVEKQSAEQTGTNKDYLGRSLPAATFAGDKNADYYQTVFPVTTSSSLTLRVDYTLVSIDGSKEEITVYGAKAVVPATYTVWQPNYAYTYIFKITDATNGWTTPNGSITQPDEGLFPITFDAVVAEATDATAEQTTITTVAVPSITTYQQGHVYTTNEYAIATAKNIYVQVMDNSAPTATLVTTLTDANSLLYAVPTHSKSYSTEPAGWPTGYYTDAACSAEATGAFSAGTYFTLATEAEVMDALLKRTAEESGNITGRNGLTLTKNAAGISNTVTSIVNGVDNMPITVASGSAAEIDITKLSAGTYAYVYNYEAATTAGTITEYQPLAVTAGSPIDGTTKTYYPIAVSDLTDIAVTIAEEDVDNDYVYFTKTTTDGGTTWTYSYISVAAKTKVPAGVVKLLKTTIAGKTPVAGTTNAAADTFYFDKYTSNNGKYAVKVIKVVD